MSGKVLARTSHRALSLEQASRILAVLQPYLSEARQARLEAALAARTRRLIVVLEDVFDEHNSAAVLRTAEALGVLEVHYAPRTIGFKVSKRVSLGSHKWIDLVKSPDIATVAAGLKARGYRVAGAALRGDTVRLEDLPLDRPLALVFGNEHAGLSAQALAAVDQAYAIPMSGFVESFNLSVAAAISMYDVMQRLRRGPSPLALEPDDVARLRATWYALSVRAAPELLARAGLPMPTMVQEDLHFEEKRFAANDPMPPEVGP